MVRYSFLVRLLQPLLQAGLSRPMVEGAWKQRLGVNPVVSITHSGGVAAAVAALDQNQLIGIDMEQIGVRPEQFNGVAFSEKERHWLQGLSKSLHEEWSLRLWCAKESAAKALGKGLSTALNGLRVAGVEVDTGQVQLELADSLLKELPFMRGKAMTARTQRNADVIFSTVVYVPEAIS